ncbi:hypothetical protein JYT16_02480 [Gemmatimonas aurantiaca]|nr:hypothetical protein [Gemmatimonas aurantiaca]
MNRVVIALALSSIVLSGCFYSFKSSGGALVESISVTQLENRTSQAGVSDQITELIIDELVNDGRIKVVQQSVSEATLSGALIAYSRRAFEFDETDQVPRYEILLTVELTLRKTGSDEEIWSETIVQSGVYDAQEETEEDGQLRAAELLVVEIMNKTTRSW